VSNYAIRCWLKKAKDENQPAEVVERRKKQREKWVDDAWDIVVSLNEIVKEKIKRGQSGFKDAREAATVLGIYMDKIGALEARHRGKPFKPAVTINILPPGGADGNPTRVDGNAIQILEQPGEISGDDSGSGVGQDVLALPGGDTEER